MKYSIGLDFGTASVRAVIVDVETGKQVGENVFRYPHGEDGVITDPADHNRARQHPQDYIDGFCAAVAGAAAQAAEAGDFDPGSVIGIGVDTTGSSPLPLDAAGTPLAFTDAFAGDPDALVWLWKDHTAHAEAAEINRVGPEHRPHYFAKIGGRYSSEWFWAKVWHCLNVNETVFAAAATWVEIADWIPATLCGITDPAEIKRCVCAAGHKALFNEAWGGYPDAEFLAMLDPRLAALRAALPDTAFAVDEKAGDLAPQWAEKMGVPAGIPVAVGAFDAHLGGVGCGIGPGVLVRNVGTSTCDIMVVPDSAELPDIPGLCGIVPGSVLPGHYGLEAGQSAVGDIFGWFAGMIVGGGDADGVFERLEAEARSLRPGQSGLLALDWMNGNRTVLVDQRLTGLVAGLTLGSTAGEIYRALLEATAFGARMISERLAEYGVQVERVVNCGGIPYKSPLLMQMYADVYGRTMELSASEQSAALGAAVAGAVVAGAAAGGYATCEDAMEKMTGVLAERYEPDPENTRVYDELFGLYRRLHDAFGVAGAGIDLQPVMKELLDIKDRA